MPDPSGSCGIPSSQTWRQGKESEIITCWEGETNQQPATSQTFKACCRGARAGAANETAAVLVIHSSAVGEQNFALLSAPTRYKSRTHRGQHATLSSQLGHNSLISHTEPVQKANKTLASGHKTRFQVASLRRSPGGGEEEPFLAHRHPANFVRPPRSSQPCSVHPTTSHISSPRPSPPFSLPPQKAKPSPAAFPARQRCVPQQNRIKLSGFLKMPSRPDAQAG